MTLQRQPADRTASTAVPPIVHEVLRSPGQPLDAETRAYFEPRFGHDFSQVRIHTDARAVESAQAVNALAYTVGRDVVLGRRVYVPNTLEGRKLLAHELAHVVQQRDGRVPGRIGKGHSIVSDPWMEAEADRQGALVTKGQWVPGVHSTRGLGQAGVAGLIQLKEAAEMKRPPTEEEAEQDRREHFRFAVRSKYEAVQPQKDVEPSEADIEGQKEALRAELPKLVETVSMTIEAIVRVNHKSIHDSAHGVFKGHVPRQVGEWGPNMLAQVQNVLGVVDGVLKLTDKEMAEAVARNRGFWGAAHTTAEIIAAAIEITGGVVGITASFASVLARLMGNLEYAELAAGMARGTALIMGKLMAWIEMVHGILIVVDPHASVERKLEGAEKIASQGGFLVGLAIGGGIGGMLLSAGLGFIVGGFAAMVKAHTEGNRKAWLNTYISTFANVLASALYDEQVPDVELLPGDLGGAVVAGRNDAVQVLIFWGEHRAKQLALELRRRYSNESVFKRELLTELMRAAGVLPAPRTRR